MKTLFVFLTLFAFASFKICAQGLSQNLRGTVYDKESQTTIPGVNIIIVGSDPLVGTTTDFNGNFIFKDLPLGRYTLKTQFLGYEEMVFNNISLVAGKESVIKIQIEESVTQLEEIKVSAKKNKAEALNLMSTVSARSFSVEETKRYAGSFNDPSRMASSYAGVTADPSGDNSIIIRGNSPAGLQWRMEGIEIPNPNHFAEEGASGGPIGILNSNMLDNSDFFTSAFPAEYGNAYSGVFDIRLRNGNNSKREYSFMAGILGVDASAEGPFKKGGKASYLVNYRYSSLALLTNMGIKVAGDAVPKYQDVSFKLNIPTKSLGTFSLFGVGGISDISESDTSYTNVFGTDMGVLGLSNKMRIDDKSYLKTTVAITGSSNNWNYKEPNDDDKFEKVAGENFTYLTAIASMNVNRKINARLSNKTGIVYSNKSFDLFSEFPDSTGKVVKQVERKGNTNLLQAYSAFRFKANSNLTFNGGIHYMYLQLNDKSSIEPRLGAKWQLPGRQSINAGVGLHSKMLTITNYYGQVQNEGKVETPNKGLDFYKSMHYVLGYEKMISDNMMAKAEVYYQSLFNIPVEYGNKSSFSAINSTAGYTNMKMENTGTGRNYGIDLTVEKFFTNFYYFTSTASLYDSKYTPSDGIERNTRFNGNYVFNLLGGKEFKMSKKENPRMLTVSVKGTYAGGLRYTPIDLEQSIAEQITVRDLSKAFDEKREDFMRFDLKLKLTKNKKKTTRSWELDIQNVTNNTNVAGEYFNRTTQEIETYTQLGLLPVLSYRIDF